MTKTEFQKPLEELLDRSETLLVDIKQARLLLSRRTDETFQTACDYDDMQRALNTIVANASLALKIANDEV